MWIVLIIAAIITFIMLLPISVTVDFKNETDLLLKFGIGPVKFKLNTKTNGSKNKKKKSKKTSKLKKKLGFKDLEDNLIVKRLKKKGFTKSVSDILTMLKGFFKTFVGTVKHCCLKKFALNISVCGEDAAACALNYGTVCAAVYGLEGALGSIIKIKEKGKDINILCDFAANQPKIEFAFTITFKVFFAFVAFLRMLFSIRI